VSACGCSRGEVDGSVDSGGNFRLPGFLGRRCFHYADAAPVGSSGIGSTIETGAACGGGIELYAESCRQSFAAQSCEELPRTLNQETTSHGRGTRHGVVLTALRTELRSRSLDLPEIDDLAQFQRGRRYAFVGFPFRYAEPGVASDAKDRSDTSGLDDW
jgi:hypothetical protein